MGRRRTDEPGILADLLERERLRREYSIKAIAERWGVSPATVKRADEHRRNGSSGRLD